jgi:YidC/Oxa1 family membrane protein insertase
MNNKKPTIPMKNLVMFFVASILIMFAWTYYEAKNRPQQVTTQQKTEVCETLMPLVSMVPIGNGLPDLWAYAGREFSRNVPPDLAKKAWDQLAEAKHKEEINRPKKPVAAPFKPEFVEMGGDGFNLQVRLINKGGGVDRVIVSRFPQADYDGREVLQKDGKRQPLHLIPSPADLPAEERESLPHELALPSFLLYLYASPDDRRPDELLGEKVWKIVARPQGAETQETVFTTDVPEAGIKVTKTFTLAPGTYHIGLSVKIEKLPGANPKPFRYQLSGGHRIPIEGVWYTSVFRNFIAGWVDKGGAARRQLDDSASITRDLGSDRVTTGEGHMQYAAICAQYFASVTCVDDEQQNKGFIEFARATAEGFYPGDRHDKPQLGDICPRMISETINLTDAPIEHKFLLYHGPIKVRLLSQLRGDKAVAPELIERYERKLNLRTMTDYQSSTWLGDFLATIGWTDLTIATTNLMHWVLGMLMELLTIPALAIIALTVLVRIALMPISRRQAAYTQKFQAKMAALQPQIKALEAEYKGRDPQDLHRAKMKLMLDNGVNPAAQLGGCLLLLAQMPIFMGLYYSLQENVFFRLHSFLWVENLAAPDMLARWGTGIPYLSDPASLGSMFYLGPYFNLLPILAVTLMTVQQWLMMPPAMDEQQAATQKMMKYMMIFMALLFYKTPSGLVLYFIVGTLWALAERKLFPKKVVVVDKSELKGKAGSDDSGGNGAKLKPKPPKPSWGRRKLQEVLDAAEKKPNTQRRR